MKQSFDLGKRIKSLLDEKGKSQSDLARYLRLRPSAVSQWISGGTSPTFDRLEDVARFFRMSDPEFLGGPAVDIVLKRIKKETPSAGNTEDASKTKT